MPVSFVKLSAVSRCRSSIWGLLTIRTLMAFGSPAEFPPPAPAQAEALSATHRAPAANAATRVFARIQGLLCSSGVHGDLRSDCCVGVRRRRRDLGWKPGCLADVPQD